MKIFLGLDTSAYTTSLALVDEAGNVVADERVPLQVETGQKGLRQAEAHFAHTRNLPLLFEKVRDDFRRGILAAVGASDRPRPCEESYMPVFLAGKSLAGCIAPTLGVPLYFFSHQEGHVEAAMSSLAESMEEFLAVHFSGGTSEVLKVKRNPKGMEIETVLATRDIYAGQLIDRVGVAMGLPFPAGPYLEQLALEGMDSSWTIPSSVSQLGISFSGAETRALKMLAEGIPKPEVAYAVLRCVANTLEKALRLAVQTTGLTKVVMAGGVMANSLIKERLAKRLAKAKITMYWATPRLSQDNAVGIAMLVKRRYSLEQG